MPRPDVESRAPTVTRENSQCPPARRRSRAPLLALVAPARGRPRGRRRRQPAAPPTKAANATLLRYASDTWASFVAMVDPDDRAPGRQPVRRTGRRSVQTSTTNIGAYMWSTLVAERLGIIDHAEAVDRLEVTLGSLETMERHEPSGQYYNWYDHHTGAKLTAWPPTGAPAHAHPVLGRQRLARDRPARRSRRRSPRSRIAPRPCSTRMDFGFYYRPDGQPDRVPCRARHGRVAVLLRHHRQREPDRHLHRHRQGRAAREGVLRRLADVPRHLRLELAGDQAARRRPGPTSASTCSRVPTRTTALRVVPGLGRQHVRGADAGPVRPRGRWGDRRAGRSTTRSRSRPRSTTASTRPTTATGASRRRTPRRRLRRLRRGRARA